MIFKKKKKKIIQDLNESGMSIDAVYFIMKSIMQEVEQKYFEYCRQEDIERAEAVQKELESDQINEESSSDAEKPVAADVNEEGAK